MSESEERRQEQKRRANALDEPLEGVPSQTDAVTRPQSPMRMLWGHAARRERSGGTSVEFCDMPQAVEAPLVPEQSVGEDGQRYNNRCAAEMQRPRLPLAVAAALLGVVFVATVVSSTSRGNDDTSGASAGDSHPSEKVAVEFYSEAL